MYRVSSRLSFAAWKPLSRIAMTELRAEVSIDERDRAVRPLIPAGWTERREPGSRSMTWSRRVTLGDVADGAQRYAVATPTVDALKAGSGARSRLYREVVVSAQFRTTDFMMWDSTREVSEYVPMTVRLQHPAQSKRMVLTIASSNSKLRLLQARFEDPGVATKPYQGPYLEELSTALQAGLYEYLGQLGITARFIEFVCQALYYEEHQEYLVWLHQLGSLAAAPLVNESSSAVTPAMPVTPNFTRGQTGESSRESGSLFTTNEPPAKNKKPSLLDWSD
jgi:hypothetical protein